MRKSTFFKAAERGDIATLKKHLAAGADINAVDDMGRTALMLACESDHLETVEFLLAQGADWRIRDSLYERDALSWALLREEAQAVECLLRCGVEVPASQRDAALLLVVQTDNIDLAARQLDDGADLNACCNRNGLPHGVEKKSFESLEALASALCQDDDEDSPEGDNALMLAARAGQAGMLTFLLARGCEPNIANVEGYTALFDAIGAENPECVRLLLDHGANPNVSLPNGWTPVFSAAGLPEPTILNLLIEYGGDIHSREEEGWTPLMEALREGCIACARCLLERGADPRACRHDGYTTLIAAARGNCSPCLAELLAGGVDLHARWQEEGCDALMLAAKDGNYEAVETLLGLGADPLAINHNGLTACQLAADHGHDAIRTLLLAHGAPPPSGGRHQLDADFCQRLVAQLQRCLPQLDAKPLLAATPKSNANWLDWLYGHLAAQRLIDYQEWKEYLGELPDLQMLDKLNQNLYAVEKLEAALEKHGYPAFPWDVPYLEYQNHFLKPHGLCLVTLAAENLYLLCLRDDEAEIAALAELLQSASIELVEYETLNLRQCLAAIREAAQ